MADNPLLELRDHGQSVWIDQIRREMLISTTDAGSHQGGQVRRDTRSELQQLIEDDGISGLTSNPTIFQKAITGSSAYDEQLGQLTHEGKSAHEAFEALAISDLQQAADLLRPVFERTGGRDGYVSMEVSPTLAYDTQGTLEEARRLWSALDRPNVLIKIPGTAEGLPAIEQAIFEGINVNVTLLFSIERYRQVMEAYIRGLERRVEAGLPIDRVFSVASFFVSRVDTLADKLIDARSAEEPQATSLKGQVAVANAKLAYQAFLQVFEGERFADLRRLGARVQRPLWASTSTKNPAYSDVLYVETLIGPRTVNTMPLETINAFRDHGKVATTVTEGLAEAQAVMDRLEEIGISIHAITSQLQDEGVKAFADSYDSLIEGIRQKQAQLGALATPRITASLGRLEEVVDETVARLHDEGAIRRIWEKDPSLWKSEPEHQKVIGNRLGWLTIADAMLDHVHSLMRLGREVRDAGYRYVVLLGMGGSSLAPQVIQATIGSAPGYPELVVLDTTDPATIRAVADRVGAGNALFIVASKSGTTVESASLDAYFYDRLHEILGDGAGEHFIAITDPGTALERSARERGFRRVFTNPADIGGRYSALSYFGLVPAALIGVDIGKFLERAIAMERSCAPQVPSHENPALWLGALMGAGALRGLDKLTLITTPTFQTFGYWAEQLVAESTGKEGRGIVPVEGEPPGEPGIYGEDRLFVYLRGEMDNTSIIDDQVAKLEQAGYPVARIHLRDAYDLAAEFYRWELATAIAGVLLGVNPFDEPNVTESKQNTNRLLDSFKQQGRLPEERPALTHGRLSAFVPTEERSLPNVLRALLRSIRPGDYIAILAYIQQTPEHHAALQAIRRSLRDDSRAATTLGYGPRFLHSTGQLHKGGPNNGVFLEITAQDVDDLPIPGQSYSFSTLKTAQALGDFLSLQHHDRRVIRIDLGCTVGRSLKTLQTVVDEAVSGEL